MFLFYCYNEILLVSVKITIVNGVIFLKIYLDTGVWIRLFETSLDVHREKDKNAIGDILDEICGTHEIISSLFQNNQLEGLKNSYTGNKQLAMIAAIAQCKQASGNTMHSTPYHKYEFEQLMAKTGLQDNEDGHHIVIAWLNGVEYFITVDYSTILSKKSDIEEALQVIPILPYFGTKDMKIVSPVMFARDVLRLSQWV